MPLEGEPIDLYMNYDDENMAQETCKKLKGCPSFFEEHLPIITRNVKPLKQIFVSFYPLPLSDIQNYFLNMHTAVLAAGRE